MAVNRLGPPCPNCGCLVTNVLQTKRNEVQEFARRRQCPCCGTRFTTVQSPEIIVRSVWPNNAIRHVGKSFKIAWELVADWRARPSEFTASLHSGEAGGDRHHRGRHPASA